MGSTPAPIAVILEDPRLPYSYQAGGSFTELDLADARRLRAALAEIAAYRFTFFDRHDGLAADLAAARPRFAFNLCDAGLRNDAALESHVPALLELLEIPYSGAGPDGLVLCRDKALASAAAAAAGVPVPAEVHLPAARGGRTDAHGRETLESFRYPAILKPNLEDGSFAITPESLVDGPAAAAALLRRLRARHPGLDLLLQEFLPGVEYSVGLVGNPETGFLTLPVNEVDYDGLDAHLPRILAYEFKTEPESRYWRQVRYREAGLDGTARERLVEHSRRLFARLGCRDYARFDFRADARGTIRLLEVNPNPAWVWKGSLHSMAARAGHDYPGFLELLLEAALARAGLGATEPRRWRPDPGPGRRPPSA